MGSGCFMLVDSGMAFLGACCSSQGCCSSCSARWPQRWLLLESLGIRPHQSGHASGLVADSARSIRPGEVWQGLLIEPELEQSATAGSAGRPMSRTLACLDAGARLLRIGAEAAAEQLAAACCSYVQFARLHGQAQNLTNDLTPNSSSIDARHDSCHDS